MVKGFFLLGSLIISSLFAHSECSGALIDEVCECAKSAVVRIDGDRVYLDPSRIFSEEEWLFVVSDHAEVIQIPFLYSSPSGLYLTSTRYKGVPSWNCTKCGRSHKERPVACERCGNTEFYVTYHEK